MANGSLFYISYMNWFCSVCIPLVLEFAYLFYNYKDHYTKIITKTEIHPHHFLIADRRSCLLSVVYSLAALLFIDFFFQKDPSINDISFDFCRLLLSVSWNFTLSYLLAPLPPTSSRSIIYVFNLLFDSLKLFRKLFGFFTWINYFSNFELLCLAFSLVGVSIFALFIYTLIEMLLFRLFLFPVMLLSDPCDFLDTLKFYRLFLSPSFSLIVFLKIEGWFILYTSKGFICVLNPTYYSDFICEKQFLYFLARSLIFFSFLAENMYSSTCNVSFWSSWVGEVTSSEWCLAFEDENEFSRLIFGLIDFLLKN